MKKYFNRGIIAITVLSFILFNCGGKEEEKSKDSTHLKKEIKIQSPTEDEKKSDVK